MSSVKGGEGKGEREKGSTAQARPPFRGKKKRGKGPFRFLDEGGKRVKKVIVILMCKENCLVEETLLRLLWKKLMRKGDSLAFLFQKEVGGGRRKGGGREHGDFLRRLIVQGKKESTRREKRMEERKRGGKVEASQASGADYLLGAGRGRPIMMR